MPILADLKGNQIDIHGYELHNEDKMQITVDLILIHKENNTFLLLFYIYK